MFIPDSAPFNEEQRAWLNGFFAGLTGMIPPDPAFASLGASGAAMNSMADSTAMDEEEFPWHDSSLPIVDRMEMADGKPLPRKLMAAMAQLDCGSCGYLCQTYAEAIANGSETNLTLCSPGGKETKQMIKKVLAEGVATEPVSNSGTPPTSKVESTVNWSRKNPFSARLIESRRLNLEGSAKDTRHVAIDLAGSGLTYQVGDALGIVPCNCDDLVVEVIRQLGAEPTLHVASPLGGEKTLMQVLREDCCLKEPSDELIELLIERISDSSMKHKLKEMLDDGVPLGTDVLDVLHLVPDVAVTVTEVLETLSPLNPRLYSIASSMKVVGQQVHLTVGKVTFQTNGRTKKGVASTMLADRIAPTETVKVFVQPNHAGFTVPADPSVPMIMVGPGTGIAPFIAFLQEREASKATGKNWLFFGDQRESVDFLYRTELEGWVQTGLLNRLDTAFSRDGDGKVYVQDRMRQKSAELWSWLESGAHFYVCGDASRMAKDVDQTLRQIVVTEGKMNENEAIAFLKQLATSGRYLRDVY